MTRLITLYQADDNDTGVKIEEFVEALLEYFSLARSTHEHSSRLKVEDGVRALSKYISYEASTQDPYKFCPNLPEVISFVKSAELPDAMVIDMRWLDDHRRPNDRAGEDIIKEIIGRKTETEVFTNTIYGSELLTQISKIASDYHILSIPGIPSVEDLISVLPDAFYRIAHKYVRRANPSERVSLLSKANGITGESLLNECVTIDGDIWTIKNLFLCCWNPIEGRFENVSETILNMTANLTLGASECFNLFGVKQLTHAGSGYFPWSDREQLKKEIVRQFNVLDTLIEAVKKIGNAEDIFAKTTYASDYLSFKDRCVSSPILSDHTSGAFDEDVMDLRDTALRFGSKAQKLNAKGKPQRQEIIIGGYKACGWFSESLDEFEINIPVHLIFEEEFSSFLLPNCKNEFGLYACRVPGVSPNHPENISATRQISLFANYLVMCSSHEFKESSLANRVSYPQYFDGLADRHFEYFGKYYVVLRKEDSLTIYDCSSRHKIHKLINQESIFPEGSSLFDWLKNDVSSKTYHLFVFHTWRQG